MPLGHIKAGLVAAFAVIFGIVQLICACMDMPSAALVSPQSHASHQKNVSGQNHHPMMEVADLDAASHDHGEHEHQADCSHCDDTVILAVTPDGTPSVFTTQTVFKTAYFDRALDTRANMAATNLAGLRWLDPPRRLHSSDPVTLHTRSLI